MTKRASHYTTWNFIPVPCSMTIIINKLIIIIQYWTHINFNLLFNKKIHKTFFATVRLKNFSPTSFSWAFNFGKVKAVWMELWCFHFNQLRNKILVSPAQWSFIGEAVWIVHCPILRCRLSCCPMVRLKSSVCENISKIMGWFCPLWQIEKKQLCICGQVSPPLPKLELDWDRNLR